MRLTILGCFVALFAQIARADISDRVQSADDVLINRQTSVVPVPAWVIDQTKCLAALKVVKAGLIWGGQGSTGMVTCRTANGHWSEPSFFTVDGVNFGIQIGVQFLESVLVFVTDLARQVLNHATFQLGADLSVAAGPVGGGGGAGQLPNASVLSYQRAVGLYAGATVNGFVLAHNAVFNKQAYGQDVAPADLLATDGEPAPAVVLPFVDTSNKYFPIH
jgi:lipid-binding SYLF domain-containing protein